MLNKQQRYQVYQSALRHFNREKASGAKSIEYGMCPILLWESGIVSPWGNDTVDELENVLNYFPEFAKHEPDKGDMYHNEYGTTPIKDQPVGTDSRRYSLWFSVKDFDSRIKVLEQCCSELKQSI